MFDEMYYEENNIIPKEEYKHIIDTLHKEKKFRPARISVVRKVFFNREINYLTDAVSVNQENTDSYCVMMTDWDTDHLILEKKSKREGLISKSYTRLSEEEKIKMCELVTNARAEFIKTSTGFSSAGATFEDVKLMHEHVGNGVKVKAAGGITSFDDAEKFISLGADRLGTSRLVKIMKGNANCTGY